MSEPNGPQVYVPPEQRDEMLALINGNRRAAGLLPQEYPGHDPYAEGGARPPAHDRSLTETVAEHEHDRRMGRTFGQAVVDLVGEPNLPFLVRLAALKAVKAVVGRWNDGGRSRDAGRLAEQFPETGARVADEFMGETRADVRQPATEPHRTNTAEASAAWVTRPGQVRGALDWVLYVAEHGDDDSGQEDAARDALGVENYNRLCRLLAARSTS